MKLRLLLSAEKLPSPSSKKLFGKNKLNAFAVLSEISDTGSVMGIKRTRLQTTEVVPQTSSPEWYITTEFEHRPGTEHRLSVDIFHSDVGPVRSEATSTVTKGLSHRGVPTPQHAQQLCSLFFDVETILTQKDYFIKEKIPGSQSGSVTARLEVIKTDSAVSRSALRFQLRGSKLGNVRRGFMEKPDYHFEVRRKHVGQTEETWCIVYRSETDTANPNPLWEMNTIPLDTLCNNDFDQYIQLRVVDIDKSGSWSTLGTVETTVREFMERSAEMGRDTDKGFPLSGKQKKLGHLVVALCDVVDINEETVSSARSVASQSMASSSVSSGSIPPPESAPSSFPPMVVAHPVVVASSTPPPAPSAPPLEVMPPPQQQQQQQSRSISSNSSMLRNPDQQLRAFINYVRNGRCNIDMCVAVDFTRANGDFRSPKSPHYRTDGNWNSYEWLMSVVAETISEFSHTQEYPMWGFGGDYNSKTYQLFQCGSKPKANGIQGLLEAYAGTFQTGISLGRHRQFNKVIEAAAHHAKTAWTNRAATGRLSYSLLLVLTPGNDSDVLAAKESIVSVEGAPLSILFVRIPSPGQPTIFDDQKLEVYLSNRNCSRPFTACFDSRKSLEGNRNKARVKQVVLQCLTRQLPVFFEQQGIR